jgi:ribosomal protein eS8
LWLKTELYRTLDKWERVYQVDLDRSKRLAMGISRSSRHKRSATGAQRAHYRKKRKFELGRQPASTKLGPKRIHTVRVRGGNVKFRALRLESGNFAWGSEHTTKKTRILGVVSIARDPLLAVPNDIDTLPGFSSPTMPLTTSLSERTLL